MAGVDPIGIRLRSKWDSFVRLIHFDLVMPGSSPGVTNGGNGVAPIDQDALLPRRAPIPNPRPYRASLTTTAPGFIACARPAVTATGAAGCTLRSTSLWRDKARSIAPHTRRIVSVSAR